MQLEHVAHPGPPGQLAVLELGSKALPGLAAITCRAQPGHAGPAATGGARLRMYPAVVVWPVPPGPGIATISPSCAVQDPSPRPTVPP